MDVPIIDETHEIIEILCRKDRSSWVKLTYTPYFDGHLWRKYGQKKIKDAEYPR